MSPSATWARRSLRAACVTLLILAHAQMAGAAAPPAPDIKFGVPTTAGTGFGPSAMAVADLNRDGVPDLVVVNSFDDTLSVLLGNVSPPATYLPAVPYATPSSPVDVVIADVDRDGVPDLVVINTVDTAGFFTLAIFLGKGDGTFAPRSDHPLGFKPYSLAVGDLDRDGVLDLVMSSDVENTVSVLLGNVSAPGTFLPAVPYPVGSSPRVVRHRRE